MKSRLATLAILISACGGTPATPPDASAPPDSPQDHPPSPDGPPPPDAAAVDPLGCNPMTGLTTSLRVWAYDEDLRSRNLRAPALTPEIQRQLRSGGTRASAPGVLITRVAVHGPCAIALSRRSDGTAGPAPPYGTVMIHAGITALALSILVVLVMHPFVRRIRRLAAAAAGGAATYTTTVDDGDDELGDLDRAMFAASRRSCAELATQHDQRRTLETLIRHTAHDVGTPLAILYGQLDDLGRQAERGGGDAATIVRARAELEHLAGVVANLATLAGAGALESRRCAVDLRDLVARVVDRHRAFAAAHDRQLEHAVPADPVPVLLEPVSVQRALGNLIENAIAYGRVGGYVAVVLELRGGGFVLRVLDDGDALTEPDLAAIQRGERGTLGHARRPHGSGLGIAIVRAVVASHGYALVLDRAADGGLEVRIRGELRAEPRRKLSAAATPAASPRSASPAARRWRSRSSRRCGRRRSSARAPSEGGRWAR